MKIKKALGIFAAAALMAAAALPFSASAAENAVNMIGIQDEMRNNVGETDANCTFEIKDGAFTTYEITPEQFGFKRCGREALAGGTPKENAQITRRILSGEMGPKREAVLLNAGASFYLAGKSRTMADGVALAASLIDSGRAMEKLEAFIKESNS